MNSNDDAKRSAAEWHELDVTGGKLAYQVTGSGRPVLFLHSVIADSRMWDRELATFRDRGRMARFDLRGFGRTPAATSPFSYSQDIGGLIAKLGFERPLLVGSSMGGALAIDFALTHPGSVGGLLLVAPGVGGGFPPPYTPEEQRAFEVDERLSKEVDLAWTQGDRRKAIDGLRQLWCAALEGPALELFRTMVEQNLEEVFGNRSMKVAEDLVPAAPRLGELRIPTTILVGDRDNPSSPVFAHRLARAIPGARLVEVPGADHLINLSKPEAFDRELRAMLDRLG